MSTVDEGWFSSSEVVFEVIGGLSKLMVNAKRVAVYRALGRDQSVLPFRIEACELTT